MKPQLAAGAALAILAAAFATASFAGPAEEDGNAGLDAMNRGDYPTAIHLFEAVLKAPDATPDDQEYAYLSLGMIHLRQDHYPQAVGALQHALQLKPDDAEAQSQLELAQAGQSGADPVAVRWGGLRLLDGGTWVSATAGQDKKHRPKDVPFYYAAYSWQTRGEVLAFTGKDQNGGAVAGTLTRDAATGVITESTTTNGAETTSYVEPTLNGYVETAEDGSQRTTYKQVDPTTFNAVTETYANNTWSQTQSYRVLQSTKLAQEMDGKAQGHAAKRCAGALLKGALVGALSGQDQGTPAECGGQQQSTDQQQQ